MNTVISIDFKTFSEERDSFYQDVWDGQEPANMVVALGDNRDGEKERFPPHVPLAKIRPKDNRSILVFNVELGYYPYVSPLSGGITYTVKNDNTNTLIHENCKWTLKEVHIGECPVGEFVGVLLYFEDHIKSDYVYYQWRAARECPPIFYGWYPEKWIDVDPLYITAHKETKRLAQMSSQYEICDQNMCCVRYGCELTCCKSIDPKSDIHCHKNIKCVNCDNIYERFLQQWVVEQQKIYKILERIPNALPALHDRLIMDTFKDFTKENMTQEHADFWEAWTQAIVSKQNDFQFITDWKVQKSKDRYMSKAVEAFKKVEDDWKKKLALSDKKVTKKVSHYRNRKNKFFYCFFCVRSSF